MNYLQKTIFVLCLCALGVQLVAQQTISETDHLLSLRFGQGYSYFKDLNYSPLNHKGSGNVIGLGYERTNTNGHLFYSHIDFATTSLTTPASEFFTTDRYQGKLALGYLRNMRSNDRLQWHLGAQYQTFLDLVFYDGTESITFFTVHGLEAATRVTYALGERHRITSDLTLPLFGLLVRPPHTGWDKFIADNEDNPLPIFFRGKWTSLNDYQGVQWTTRYDYAFSNRLEASVQYRFRYQHTNELEDARHADNQFTVGLNFRF